MKTINQLLFVALTGTSLLCASASFAAKNIEYPERRTVSVTGNAEVRVVPDEIILSFGVETSSTKKLLDAKLANDTIVSKALEIVRANGIEPKYIHTDNISLEPRYVERNDRRVFVGYFARKGISVTLKDMAKLENIMSGVIEIGVSNINGVNFRTSELRKHRDKARVLALNAALEKAKLLASQLGESVGRVVSIQENPSSVMPYANYWWTYNSQNIAQNASMSMPGDSSSDEGPTPLGMISVNATVSVTFELVY